MPSSSLNITVRSMINVLDLKVDSSSLGQELFDEVLRNNRIRERWFFGMAYVDSKNVLGWLQLDKKLSKVDFREKNGQKINLILRARLFPEDVSTELIEFITQELFYLQVQESILSEEIYCPAETAILLASYAMQAKYGDHDDASKISVRNERLLPKGVIAQYRLSPEDWENRIINWWKEHSGMMKEDARMEYLKVAQDLEMYGVRYFEVRNKKKTELFLGIDSLGINICSKSDKKIPKIGFAWGEIANVFVEKKKLMIKSVEKASEIVFFVERRRINRQILSLCKANHGLYMARRRPEEDTIQALRRDAEQERKRLLANFQREQNEKQKRINGSQKTAQSNRSDSTNRSKSPIATEVHVAKPPRSFPSANDERKSPIETVPPIRENRLSVQSQKSTQFSEYNEGDRLSHRADTVDDHTLKSLIDRMEYPYFCWLDDLNQTVQSIERANGELQRKSEEANRIKRDLSRTNSQVKNLLRRNATNVEEENGNPYESAEPEHLEDDDDETSHNDKFQENFEVRSNVPRPEETREIYIKRDKNMETKSRELRRELEIHQRRDIVSTDQIYRENTVDKGIDKYKTLKKIREGTVKRRIDEFEAM